MKSRNDRVLEWAVDKVSREYRDDVAILAVYGSYVNKTADELSDVDFFFIPKTERGFGLSRTFIIENVGFDLFPMRWGRVEGLSEFREPLAPLLGDSEIAFASTPDDERHFLSLREKMDSNLRNSGFMHERALASYSKGIVYLNELRAAQQVGACRLLAGRMLLCLSDAVAYENRTYFRRGLKSHFDDLSRMDALPPGLLEAYDGIVAASDGASLKASAEKMASCCRGFLRLGEVDLDVPEHGSLAAAVLQKGGEPINHEELVSFYEETVSTFNKVWRSCEGSAPDCRKAFIAGVCLQRVLDEEVFQLGLEVLGSFDWRDLRGFASACRRAEHAIVSEIEKVGPLARFENFEEFISSSG